MSNSFKGKVGTMYFRGVPRHLRDCFHATCLQRGDTMSAVFIRFMKRYIKKKGMVQYQETIVKGKKVPDTFTKKKRKKNGRVD